MSASLHNDATYLKSCPGCKSQNITLLQPDKVFRIFVTDGNEMSVVVGVSGCQACGLTFLNPRMGEKTLFEYYSKQSRIPRADLNPASPFAALMNMQVDFIRSFIHLNDGMNVLEIGCAEGFFLKTIKDRSDKNLNLYGVELSKKYLEQATRNIPKAKLFAQPMEEVDFGNLKFDVIVLRHVFEHLGDPSLALKKIRSVLNPKGILYIEVPDSHHVDLKLSSFYHHEHLLYFTRPTLKNYLEAHGLSPLANERFTDNPLDSGFSYPVIRSISTPAEAKPMQSFPNHAKEVYLENMSEINAANDKLLASVRKRLNEHKNRNSKIGLFGAGPHTMELLGLLENLNIDWKKLFDNNPNKQGKRMRNIPIEKPEARNLGEMDCILISSAEFEKEMASQVRGLVGPSTEILTLYGH